METWSAVENYPGILCRQFGGRFQSYVTKVKVGGFIKWSVADYDSKADQWFIFAEGQAENIKQAEQAIEAAAAKYACSTSRPSRRRTPLSSTERNQLRMERLIAKEVAADLGAEKLRQMHEKLRRSDMKIDTQEVLFQIEAVMRTTALRAFATYCKRVTVILQKNDRMDKKYGAEIAISDLVSKIDYLSQNTEKMTAHETAEIFNATMKVLRQHGFLQEQSLAEAVAWACSPMGFGTMPEYSVGPNMMDTSWMVEVSRRYGETFGGEISFNKEDDTLHMIDEFVSKAIF